DLFSCFIDRSISITKEKGFMGNVTMESWMFLSSFEKFRKELLDNVFIESLSHFGWHIMRIAFGTVAFVTRNSKPNEKEIVFYNYLEIEEKNKEIEKPYKYPNKERRFAIKNQKDFEKIPGNNIGYWLNMELINKISENKKLIDYGKAVKGLDTCDNNRFTRIWSENSLSKIEKKWFFYQKGGEYRKWYGNIDIVVNWEDDGDEIKNFRDENGKIKSRP